MRYGNISLFYPVFLTSAVAGIQTGTRHRNIFFFPPFLWIDAAPEMLTNQNFLDLACKYNAGRDLACKYNAGRDLAYKYNAGRDLAYAVSK